MNSDALWAMPSGDVLKLRPERAVDGSQCVGARNAVPIGPAGTVHRSSAVNADTSGVSALHTLGVWVLEKLAQGGSPGDRPNSSALPILSAA